MSWLYQPLLPGGAQQQGAVVEGDGRAAAAGTSTAIATSEVFADALMSAAGTSTASAVGEDATPGAFADGAMSASGAATAEAVGEADGEAIMAAAGASAAQAVGEDATGAVIVDGAMSATGASAAIAIGESAAGAEMSADGGSTAEADGEDATPAAPPVEETAPGLGGGGGFGPTPQPHFPKVTRRARRTYVIKVGDWPEGEFPDPVPVDIDPLDMSEILRAQPRATVPTHDDGDEEEALIALLALAA